MIASTVYDSTGTAKAAANLLSGAGDYLPLILQQAGHSAPDTAGRVTIQGTYAGATLYFQKALTAADYAAGNWTALQTVVRNDTFAAVAGGVLAPCPDSLATDFGVSSIQNVYAIRLYLAAALTSGSVNAVVQSFPAGTLDYTSVLAQQTLELRRLRLGLSNVLGYDFSEVGANDSV